MYKLFLLCLSLIIFSEVSAQEKEYNLNEIVISSARVPVSFSDLARSVEILNSAEIKLLPVNNLQDIFKYINSVDLKTRGVDGVQGDIGIRGGTYEQTLILIDGVKISDSQTGHHNMNIPLSPDNIERIEVLKGQGSRIYGPNAFGGAINIITKKEKISSLGISAEGGQNKSYNYGISSSIPVASVVNNFSLSHRKSDGYRKNTNYDIIDFSFSQNYTLNNGVVNFFYGYQDKKFGANNFYSDLYPNQWEHTTTKILDINSEVDAGGIILSPKVFWRHNDDDYILDNRVPNYYRNNHRSDSYGLEIQSSFSTDLGKTSLGGEINYEELKSTSLGSRVRLKGGFFAEQNLEIAKSIFISTGFYTYNYSKIGWKVWPGLDAAYKFSQNTKIFASVGSAFRIPTFTELYYKSPANLGNPNLKYEQTTNYEIGFASGNNSIWIESSVFYKDGKNIIDWTRVSKTSPWQVENVTSLKTKGIELSFTYLPNKSWNNFPISKINLGYTYLSLDRSTGAYQSKYVLDNLRHQLTLTVDNDLLFGLSQSWSFNFRDRESYKPIITVDSQISLTIDRFYIYVRGTNLINVQFEDLPGVMLPGRWISAGIKFNVKDF